MRKSTMSSDAGGEAGITVKAPTIYSIAKQVGVSPSTVSRAFSRPHLVRASVREEILAVAKEHGFQPNQVARGLATGRTGLIGIVSHDANNPFSMDFTRATQRFISAGPASPTGLPVRPLGDAVRSGPSVIMADGTAGACCEAHLIAGISRQVDGLILQAVEVEDSVLRAALGRKPTVLVEREAAGLPSVVFDTRAAISEAGDHLYDLGHRRFLVVPGPANGWAANERVESVRAWASTRPEVELVEAEPTKAAYDAGRLLHDTIVGSGASAVFSYDDHTATGIIAGLEDAGVRVPADVSVVGVGGVLLGRVSRPRLTTAGLCAEELGRTAHQLLVEAAAGLTPRAVRLQASFTPVDSTGPVAGAVKG